MEVLTMAVRLSLLHPVATELSTSLRGFHSFRGRRESEVSNSRLRTQTMSAVKMATGSGDFKVIDSHLHVWASPEQAKEKYPYFPGQEPSLPGDAEFLLKCMGEGCVDGTLIVQPINHMFDHSYVTSVLKQYPSKFVGCCLANPAEDGAGVKQFEDLVSKDGYRAVRFNPNLWPSGQLMTNQVGKALFAKAGELGVPVGFLCMKGIDHYISEIEELCMEFPSTPVLIDHLGFCKVPTNHNEEQALSKLLNLSRFPQVHVKFSALFRLSRRPYPYDDLSDILAKLVASYGANRVMWGSDFPFVVPECGYKEAKEATLRLIEQAQITPSEMESIMGRTVDRVFSCRWTSP